jgi:hypothetical protein
MRIKQSAVGRHQQFLDRPSQDTHRCGNLEVRHLQGGGVRVEEEVRARAVRMGLFIIIIICAAVLAGNYFWPELTLDHSPTSAASGKLIK